MSKIVHNFIFCIKFKDNRIGIVQNSIFLKTLNPGLMLHGCPKSGKTGKVRD